MATSVPNEITQAAGGRLPGRWVPWGFGMCVLIGALSFGFGVVGSLGQRAWQSFLVNFVFWTGLVCGAVMISAVLVITKANWGRPIQRLAESPVLFLPVAFLLFWLLYFGKDLLFPWIHEPVPEKRAWLNTGFFFAREGGVLLLLALAAVAMVFTRVRRDQGWLRNAPHASPPDALTARSRAQVVYANIFGIFFGVLLTILAFDLIMSLNPHWYSTLFGAYYFVGSFFCGLAAVYIICAVAKRRLGLAPYIKPLHMHNLGKLLLGFCLMTADFFYAQFFIMWYGNLPEETRYVLQRVRESPWEPVAWIVLLGCFVGPFVILLSRRIKMKPVPMVILCTLILAGMWLERFLLIAPSLWKGQNLPLGWMEGAISLGFFGIVGLCTLIFLNRYPLLPVSDPLFWKGLERME